MLLTLTTTHVPATDLGFLLHKNPARAQSFELPSGAAHVVWPEASPERATAALILDIDPVALVRGRRDSPGAGPLALYVNDRPYVASSFLSVAIARVFGSALNGRSKERPELVGQAMPLEVRIDVVSCRGGPSLLGRLFEPLGYGVEAERLMRDEAVPEWGESRLYRLVLRHTLTVAELLNHLYVLLPVLDDEKHYWVGRDEVDKLVKRAGDWLADHPERELIARRTLRHQGALVRAAMSRFEAPEEAEAEEREPALEKPIRLNELRLRRLAQLVDGLSPRRVADVGCGEGQLLRRLMKVKGIEEIVGMDVSARALDVAERRLDKQLGLEDWRTRLKLLNGSVTYRDRRLDGFDLILAVEVIEHIDASRLEAFSAALLGGAKPRVLVVTTPNAEYNALLEGLPEGRMRHPDHRFEWSRAELRAWAEGVGERYGYGLEIEGIGAAHETLGAPTQMAVFTCP